MRVKGLMQLIKLMQKNFWVKIMWAVWDFKNFTYTTEQEHIFWRGNSFIGEY